jgi:hypothetical protein
MAIEWVTEEKEMVDYSEAFLQLDRNLRSVYELMLKGRKQEAVNVLEKIADIAKFTASWIENENKQ